MDNKLVIAENASENRVHFLINAGLNLLVCAVALAMIFVEWFSYCYFSWNLYDGETSNISLKEWVSSPSSISDIHNGLCGEFEFVIDGACNDFCGNIRRFQHGGILQLIFLSLVVLVSLFYTLQDFLALADKHKRHYLICHGIWALPTLYLLGFALYLSVSNAYGLDSTFKSSQDFQTGPGLILGFIGVALCFLPSIHAYNFTAQYML